ncbi:helix-turn-helix transcriptional regulator [Eubacterium ventriosum]|uniref:helix-turn-helix transcriptional regulator n=1 Tax=Eubacterium ventriosum TaxID=39496 RepID=UPI003520CFC4
MNEKFLKVEDIMEILGISKSAAYKLMRELNEEMAKKVQVHLDTILEELQTLDEADRGIDIEELLVPLKYVLDILQSDEKGGNHYE